MFGEQLEFDFEDTRNFYWEGYETGIKWDANWMPGGPFVYSGNDEAIKRQSKREAAAWHRGFNDGLAVLLDKDRDFANWFENNKSNRDCRYVKDSTNPDEKGENNS